MYSYIEREILKGDLSMTESKKDKRRRVRLVKVFSYGEKVVFEGSARKAERLISPKSPERFRMEEVGG